MPVQSINLLCTKIIRVEIDLIAVSLKVYLCSGYIDSNNSFQSIGSVNSIDIINADAISIFSLSGTAGVSMYSTLKTALYDYLITKNIATGTII